MNKNECANEKMSSRTIGLLILPVALFLTVICNIVLPILGSIFALPLFILSGAFLVAPESRICKLVNSSD